MDSILKNVGGPYRTLFSRNLLQTFSDAYLMVDGEDKQRFIKVVKTWKTNPAGPIFSLQLICQLETLLMNPASRRGSASQPPGVPQLLVYPKTPFFNTLCCCKFLNRVLFFRRIRREIFRLQVNCELFQV
jgi:hypothetical protein